MARDDRRVTYPIDPATTALVSVDIQVGFGRDSWEPVPHANAAVRNFVRAAHNQSTPAGGHSRLQSI